MNKLFGADVGGLFNCGFLKPGFKVCLFARIGDYRPRLHCLRHT